MSSSNNSSASIDGLFVGVHLDPSASASASAPAAMRHMNYPALASPAVAFNPFTSWQAGGVNGSGGVGVIPPISSPSVPPITPQQVPCLLCGNTVPEARLVTIVDLDHRVLWSGCMDCFTRLAKDLAVLEQMRTFLQKALPKIAQAASQLEAAAKPNYAAFNRMHAAGLTADLQTLLRDAPKLLAGQSLTTPRHPLEEWYAIKPYGVPGQQSRGRNANPTPIVVEEREIVLRFIKEHDFLAPLLQETAEAINAVFEHEPGMVYLSLVYLDAYRTAQQILPHLAIGVTIWEERWEREQRARTTFLRERWEGEEGIASRSQQLLALDWKQEAS